MPIETIPGTDIRYHLVSLDDKGSERTDDPDGRMSDRIKAALRAEQPTDVFVFIHGWKGTCRRRDTSTPRGCRTLMQQTGDLVRARAGRPGFVPLLVGLHWPSLPFGDESLRPGASFAVGADGPLKRDRRSRAADRRYAGRTCGLAHDLRSRAERRLRARHIAGGRGGGLPHPRSRIGDASRRRRWRSRCRSRSLRSGCRVCRGQRRRREFRRRRGVRRRCFRRWCNCPFWKMKDRAKRVGEAGGFALLSALMHASEDRDVRFHLMGHSFGCIAASASACGPPNGEVAATLAVDRAGAGRVVVVVVLRRPAGLETSPATSGDSPPGRSWRARSSRRAPNTTWPWARCIRWPPAWRAKSRSRQASCRSTAASARSGFVAVGWRLRISRPAPRMPRTTSARGASTTSTATTSSAKVVRLPVLTAISRDRKSVIWSGPRPWEGVKSEASGLGHGYPHWKAIPM